MTALLLIVLAVDYTDGPMQAKGWRTEPAIDRQAERTDAPPLRLEHSSWPQWFLLTGVYSVVVMILLSHSPRRNHHERS